MKIRTRAITMTAIILAFSMMSVPGLIGSQRGFGVAQGQPSSLYPINITLSTGEKILLATHTSDLANGNWIELGGGTPIMLPSVALVYSGPDTATYTRDGVTVTIESIFQDGQATYPLATHHVYSAGQPITATFWGATALKSFNVDFKLFRLTSVSEIRDIAIETFQGNLAPILDKLDNPSPSSWLYVDLGAYGDATIVIDPQEAGIYLLAVVMQNALNIYIHSATIIEVVDHPLDVTCSPSVKQGDPLNVYTELIGATPGFYIHGAAMIKETAYSGKIELTSQGSILSTELYLNDVLVADGALALATSDLSDLDPFSILDQLMSIFGSNQLSVGYTIQFDSVTGAMSLSTSSLTPGDYVLLVGVCQGLGSRIVGLYQTTVTVLSSPVANPDGPYSGKPGVAITFDGTGSSDPDGTILNYDWDFGDDTIGEGATVSHTYSSTGTYTVTLTVTDDDGLTNSDSTTATISTPPSPPPYFPPMNMKPMADAGPNVKIPVNATIHFTGSRSYDKDGYIISYSWDFGDGTTATEENVSNNYTEPGHYTVTLTVKDNKYAQDSDKCEVFVWKPPAPVADKFGQLVPGEQKGFKVNALKQTKTTITLNTTDQVTVTILKYDDAPHPDDPIPATAIQIYADVDVSDPDAIIWPIYVEMHYTDEEVEGLDEYSLSIYYWMDDAWHRCSDTGVDTDANVVWAYMTEEEASGSPILMGGMPAIAPPPILSNLTITPTEIELGEEVTISFVIENIDSQSHTYVPFVQIGHITIMDGVELEAYESVTVSHTVIPDIVGFYEVQIAGLTGNFTVNAPPLKPAEFVASDLSITPEEVGFEEEVEISFTVTNIGELPGDYAFTLGIEGPLLTGSVVINGSLEAGKSERASYMLGTNVPGTYSVELDGLTGSFTMKELKPAEFEVTSLSISPDEVEPDATVTVSATITNIGEESGGLIIEFKLDGMVVDTKTVDLNGGESETVTFTTSSESEGLHSVEIEVLSGSFTVEAPPKDNLLYWFAIVVVLVTIALYMIWKRTDWIDQLRARLK